jgi:starvation-inducible DNA-binding protein
MSSEITVGLQQALSDTYALMIKTHLYHWNVTGNQFSSLHTQFQTQYEELFLAVDGIAERIRQLGTKVEGGIAHFAENSNLPDPDAITASQMLEELLIDHQSLSASLVSFAKMADELGDRVTADLLTARAASHDKAAWMIGAQVQQHK